jgi:Family of unknown function (DUF5808)
MPDKQGKFLGIPYDWRRPSKERFKQRSWNAEDPRIWTPKSHGWGYTINFKALGRRLRGR